MGKRKADRKERGKTRSGKPGVADRKMPLKDAHVLIPGTCQCVTLHG